MLALLDYAFITFQINKKAMVRKILNGILFIKIEKEMRWQPKYVSE